MEWLLFGFYLILLVGLFDVLSTYGCLKLCPGGVDGERNPYARWILMKTNDETGCILVLIVYNVIFILMGIVILSLGGCRVGFLIYSGIIFGLKLGATSSNLDHVHRQLKELIELEKTLPQDRKYSVSELIILQKKQKSDKSRNYKKNKLLNYQIVNNQGLINKQITKFQKFNNLKRL